MKIELTKEQYKTLITIIYCGEWVMNAHKEDEDAVQKKTKEVEDIIHAQAEKAGLKHWVEYDEDIGSFLPTLKMETEIHDYITDFKFNVITDFFENNDLLE